jgi:CRISPR-associated exonuclease Cas4
MAGLDDDHLLPLSGLQHLVFCERQAALILVERAWADNSRTIEGKRLHRRTDEAGPRCERRGELVVLRSLGLVSLDLGLIGVADVVELRRADDGKWATVIPGLEGCWSLAPVEYKRGRPKPDRCDEVQVCAQALCLEEMFGVEVPAGALYYGTPRRRTEVCFDADLRDLVRNSSRRLHEIVDHGITPRGELQPKCRSCSLIEICIPGMFARASAGDYVERSVYGDCSGGA